MTTQQARCQELAGATSAAQLLFRIAYWHPKMKRVREGLLWIVKSREEWCGETGLSLDRYKRALARLKRLGLVEARQMMNGWRNVTHLRLTDDAVARLGLPVPALHHREGRRCTTGRGGAAPPSGAGLHHSMNHHVQHHVQHHVRTCATQRVARIGGNRILHPEQEETVAVPAPGKKKNTPDAVATMRPPVGTHRARDVVRPAPPEPPATVPGLALLWQERVAAVHGGYQPPPTARQRGQLRAFLAACPPGRAPRVLAWCVDHWSAFLERAAHQDGAFPLPARPQIGFVLRHVGVAVNAWLDASAPAPSVPAWQPIAPPPAAAASAEPVPVAAGPPVEPAPAGLDEVLALAGDLFTEED
jgi:hypothetical protein